MCKDSPAGNRLRKRCHCSTCSPGAAGARSGPRRKRRQQGDVADAGPVRRVRGRLCSCTGTRLSQLHTRLLAAEHGVMTVNGLYSGTVVGRTPGGTVHIINATANADPPRAFFVRGVFRPQRSGVSSGQGRGMGLVPMVPPDSDQQMHMTDAQDQDGALRL